MVSIETQIQNLPVIPDTEDMVKLTVSTLGFTALCAKSALRNSRQGSQHPQSVGGDNVVSNLNKNKLTARVYTQSKGDYPIFLGASLAKRPWIQSTVDKQDEMLRLNGDRISKKYRNLTTVRRTFDSNGNLIKSDTILIRSFTRERIQIGTRIDSKGRVKPRYKTVYKQGSVDERIGDTWLRFRLKNGEWRSVDRFQLASRPESIHWDNWMINGWNEKSSYYEDSIATFISKHWDELIKYYNIED